ncbi:IS5/IS1182 family transposase, partial [Streptomyces sp. NPDC059460]
WQNAFYRLARCYERRATVIDAFFDLADTIITVRSLIRQAWTTHRWADRPNRRP